MSKPLMKKTTVYEVAKDLATAIAENANGGMTLVELACRSSYFADLNPSEIREQITSDLERKVAAHLVKYHGWAKVQRLAGLCTKIRYVAEPAHFVLWLAY